MKATSSNKIAKVKKGPACTINTDISGNNLPPSLNAKPNAVATCSVTSVPRSDEAVPGIAVDPVPCSMDVSPSKSDGISISLDETMSTCDSFKSPEVEYIYNNDIPAIDFINKKTLSNLYISENVQTAGLVSFFFFFSFFFFPTPFRLPDNCFF